MHAAHCSYDEGGACTCGTAAADHREHVRKYGSTADRLRKDVSRLEKQLKKLRTALKKCREDTLEECAELCRPIAEVYATDEDGTSAPKGSEIALWVAGRLGVADDIAEAIRELKDKANG